MKRDRVLWAFADLLNKRHAFGGGRKAWFWARGVREALRVIEDLPCCYAIPAVMGQWEQADNGRRTCSCCGAYALFDREGNEVLSDCCPSCGVCLRKEQKTGQEGAE